MKIAGNSITPCGATKLVSCPSIPARQHAPEMTPKSRPLNASINTVPMSAGDSEREGRERDRQIIGHNVARLQRLHTYDRMRPHLLLRDRVHHGGAQDVSLESWVHESHHQSCGRGGEKDGSRRNRVWQGLMKYLRECLAIKLDDADWPRAPSHIDQVMRTSKELIQVVRQIPAGGVFADRGEVGSGLAI